MNSTSTSTPVHSYYLLPSSSSPDATDDDDEPLEDEALEEPLVEPLDDWVMEESGCSETVAPYSDPPLSELPLNVMVSESEWESEFELSCCCSCCCCWLGLWRLAGFGVLLTTELLEVEELVTDEDDVSVVSMTTGVFLRVVLP